MQEATHPMEGSMPYMKKNFSPYGILAIWIVRQGMNGFSWHWQQFSFSFSLAQILNRSQLSLILTTQQFAHSENLIS